MINKGLDAASSSLGPKIDSEMFRAMKLLKFGSVLGRMLYGHPTL